MLNKYAGSPQRAALIGMTSKQAADKAAQFTEIANQNAKLREAYNQRAQEAAAINAQLRRQREQSMQQAEAARTKGLEKAAETVALAGTDYLKNKEYQTWLDKTFPG